METVVARVDAGFEDIEVPRNDSLDVDLEIPEIDLKIPETELHVSGLDL